MEDKLTLASPIQNLWLSYLIDLLGDRVPSLLSLAEIQKTTVALLGGLRFFVTFCCGLLSDYLESVRIFRQRNCWERNESWITFKIWVNNSLIMFGYQLVKCFHSPGYEVWEDWREPYLSIGMKLGLTEEEMMKWLLTKLFEWALNAVSGLPRDYWRSTPGKQAWTVTETLYQFDIRLSDNPLFYERSYNLFVRGKARIRADFIETSDTVDQRTRQQCAQKLWMIQVEALTLV